MARRLQIGQEASEWPGGFRCQEVARRLQSGQEASEARKCLRKSKYSQPGWQRCLRGSVKENIRPRSRHKPSNSEGV